jgi:pimeloyl-ACP methyl ester carboxylesterase
MSDNALVYIHGKGGTASAAETFKPLFTEYEIFGFDYKAEKPWEAEPEFREYITTLYKEYGPLTVIASSLGAYFLMISDVGSMLKKAFFVSPVVDMECLIKDMMTGANVTEEELKEKGIISISEDMILSWDYLSWVREHPIAWNVQTCILYGERDHLQSVETMRKFAESINADLTVMPNGEHWFHTEEQIEFREKWLKASGRQGGSDQKHSVS